MPQSARSPALLLLLAFASVLLLAVGGCRKPSSQAGSAESAVEPLKTHWIEVRPQLWPRTVKVQGSLLADEQVVIGAKVAGRVKEVRVDLGMPVHQGDPLVLLDTADFQFKMQQAEAQLEQARARLGIKPGANEEKLDHAAVPAVLQEKALSEQAGADLTRHAL